MKSEPTPTHDGIDCRRPSDAAVTAVQAVLDGDLLLAFSCETRQPAGGAGDSSERDEWGELTPTAAGVAPDLLHADEAFVARVGGRSALRTRIRELAQYVSLDTPEHALFADLLPETGGLRHAIRRSADHLLVRVYHDDTALVVVLPASADAERVVSAVGTVLGRDCDESA